VSREYAEGLGSREVKWGSNKLEGVREPEGRPLSSASGLTESFRLPCGIKTCAALARVRLPVALPDSDRKTKNSQRNPRKTDSSELYTPRQGKDGEM
jgi:hypothetical protein